MAAADRAGLLDGPPRLDIDAGVVASVAIGVDGYPQVNAIEDGACRLYACVVASIAIRIDRGTVAVTFDLVDAHGQARIAAPIIVRVDRSGALGAENFQAG
jgi:hypothetical protein